MPASFFCLNDPFKNIERFANPSVDPIESDRLEWRQKCSDFLCRECVHEAAPCQWTRLRASRGFLFNQVARHYAGGLLTEHSGKKPSSRLKHTPDFSDHRFDHRGGVVGNGLNIDDRV